MQRSVGRFARNLALAAGVLGGAAAINAALARRAEARHPPRGRFIEVDGVRLHYLVEGEGPTIVLLHGNAVTAEDFAASGLLGQLARTHRVIAFDRPGYGFSQRPRRRLWTAEAQARLIARAMERLAVAPCLVLGHSWGAFVAAEMARTAPDAVLGVVLASGYYRPTLRPDAVLAAIGATPGLGDLAVRTISPLIARVTAPLALKIIFAPEDVSPSFLHRFPQELMFRPGQLRAGAVEAGRMWTEASGLLARLRKLGCPILILCGEEDRLLDSAHQSEWLARRLPRSEFLSLRGAGHMAHYAPGGVFGDSVEAFSREVAALPGGGRRTASEAAPQAEMVG